jgi:hypothetical protein
METNRLVEAVAPVAAAFAVTVSVVKEVNVVGTPVS